MAIRAVLYARFSPRPNAEESESCEKQKEICEEYCRRKGYEIDGYFEDKALSGDDADRPGLWAAIGALRRGYVLVVRWRSRLARDVYLSEYIGKEVKKVQARIESVEEVNGDTPDDVFICQILAAMSEREKKITAARTKYAMLKHQKNGLRMGLYPPYGWHIDPENEKRYVVNEDEQRVIELMKTLRKEGNSLKKIGHTLDMMGHKPQRAERWGAKVVLKILRREGLK